MHFSMEPAESKHLAFSDLLDGITVTVMEGAGRPDVSFFVFTTITSCFEQGVTTEHLVMADY